VFKALFFIPTCWAELVKTRKACRSLAKNLAEISIGIYFSRRYKKRGPTLAGPPDQLKNHLGE
jgi:hypothetical protein